MMAMTPDAQVELVRDRLEKAGYMPRRGSTGWTASCPAHDDRGMSLHLGCRRDGTVSISCANECLPERILEELKLGPEQVLSTRPQEPPAGAATTEATDRASDEHADAPSDPMPHTAGSEVVVYEPPSIEIPDPRNAPIPPGWLENVAAPAILGADSLEVLDEVEARLRAFASYIESFGRDKAEFEKALRLVEARRGQLLGPRQQGRRTDLELPARAPEVESSESPRTQARWRKIGEHIEDLWPLIRDETDPRKVSQAGVLRQVRELERAKGAGDSCSSSAEAGESGENAATAKVLRRTARRLRDVDARALTEPEAKLMIDALDELLGDAHDLREAVTDEHPGAAEHAKERYRR